MNKLNKLVDVIENKELVEASKIFSQIMLEKTYDNIEDDMNQFKQNMFEYSVPNSLYGKINKGIAVNKASSGDYTGATKAAGRAIRDKASSVADKAGEAASEAGETISKNASSAVKSAGDTISKAAGTVATAAAEHPVAAAAVGAAAAGDAGYAAYKGIKHLRDKNKNKNLKK